MIGLKIWWFKGVTTKKTLFSHHLKILIHFLCPNNISEVPVGDSVKKKELLHPSDILLASSYDVAIGHTLTPFSQENTTTTATNQEMRH